MATEDVRYFIHGIKGSLQELERVDNVDISSVATVRAAAIADARQEAPGTDYTAKFLDAKEWTLPADASMPPRSEDGQIKVRLTLIAASNNNNNNNNNKNGSLGSGSTNPGSTSCRFQHARPQGLHFADSGLSFSGRQPISSRFETATYIKEQMEQESVILIRAPPGAGKTSFAQLLEIFFNKHGAKVELVDLSILPDGDFEALALTLDEGSVEHPIVLLLDECQSAYTKTAALPLWRKLKHKSAHDDTPNSYVIAFAAFGHNRPAGDFGEHEWNGAILLLNAELGHEAVSVEVTKWIYDDCHSNMGVLDEVITILRRYFTAFPNTPLTTGYLQGQIDYNNCKADVLSWTPFAFPLAFGAYLLYARRNEVHEYIEQANALFSSEKLHLHISGDVESYLFALTRGHLGYLAQALRVIYNAFKVQALRDIADVRSLVTDAVLVQFLSSKSFLDNMQLFRAAPSLGMMSPPEKSRIIRHLFDPKLPFPINPDERAVVYSLMKKGILFYADGTFEQHFNLARDSVDFISPIIALLCFVEIYGKEARTTIPNNNLQLGSFLEKVVERMDPNVLQSTQGVGIDGRYLERVWQMEFYRVAMSLLSLSQFVSPEVGGLYGLAKRCDFYVNSDLCWLIEVVRDGDKLGEHLQRFGIGGGHGEYLLIPNKDFVVVDFYTRTLASLPSNDPHYWAVEILPPAYNCARISHSTSTGQIISKQVMLVGNADAFIVRSLASHFNTILL